jgi:putative spermidine/putrescine transport system permease protein
VNIALFLSDIHVTPLSVQLLNYVQQSADPLGAAVASLLVIIAFILIVVCDRIVGIDWLFGIRKAN